VTIAFSAFGIEHNTICLIDYHPYRVANRDGEKVKNPKFGVECGQLLDVKGDPAGRNYRAAVAAFGNRLAKTLKEHPQLARYASVDIAIIPKSEAGKVAPGLVAVAERLMALDKRFVLPRTQILTRVKTIEKLANGGNRAMHVHINSIVADIPMNRKGRAILLLDDIGTSGKSVMACTTLLYGAGASRVFPVVLGRTT
jgi:predicted amidophosphoribosyltransferase